MNGQAHGLDETFISYSRKDKAFVERMCHELASRRRAVWVDWEMEPLERWEQSIRHAIDRAIAVVVVLTPDWLASRECAKELQRATEQHKRLLPILYRKVDDGLVDGSIRSINWIDFSDDSAFDASVGLLLKGLDEDPEWKRRLAQLLTQAVRWDDGGRDPSQTLRGRGLREAEQLMGAAAQNEPKPTELQAHYVLESRRAVARRQRLTLTAIAVAAIIAVSLSIVAYFQSQERSRQERIAGTRRLINQAEALRNFASQPAGLIDSVDVAVEALTGAVALNVDIASADESVRRGLDLLPKPPIELRAEKGESRAIAFDPTGRYVAIARGRDRIDVWDTDRQRELARVTITPQIAGMQIRGVAVASDAQYVAATILEAGSASLVVWRLMPQEEQARFAVSRDPINQRLALSPDGAYAFLSGLDGAEGWNVRSGSAFNPFPSNAIPGAVAFSPTGDRIALAYRTSDTRDRVVEILDASTSSRRARWFESQTIRELRWTKDGERLAVLGADLVLVRNANQGALQYAARLDAETFALDVQGRLIASTGAGYEVTVRDAESGDVQRRLLHPVEVKGLAFGPDDRSVITFAVDSTVRVWTLGHGSAFDELAHADPIADVRFADDDIVTRSESGVRRWRLPRREETAVSAVGRGEPESSMPPPTPTRLSARIIKNGTRVELIDASGGVAKTVDFSAPVGAAAVSESGRRLGVLVSSEVNTRPLHVRPTIETWDLEHMQRSSSVTPDYTISRRDFTYVSFDPDDRYLVTKADDGFRIWDATTLSLLYSVFHGDPSQIAFQPNGPLAATASADRTVRLWRLEGTTPTEVARLRPRSPLKQLRVDAAGRWVAGVDENGRAPLWVVQPAELITQACARISVVCELAPRPPRRVTIIELGHAAEAPAIDALIVVKAGPEGQLIVRAEVSSQTGSS